MSEEAPSPRGSRRSILLGIGLLAVVALAAGTYWELYLHGIVESDDARFAADLLDIAPQVGGTLAEVLVEEGDTVTRGQPLFHLDATPLQAAVDRAEAAVDSARAALAVAEATRDKSINGPRREEIRIAIAAEEKAAAQEKLIRTELQRTKALLASGAVSGAELEREENRLETARLVHQEATEHLSLLREGTRAEDLLVSEQQVELARAQLAVAEAAARQARINLDEAQVQAPFDGVVVRSWLEPGSSVAPGRTVLTLLNPATVHVAANVEEKSLSEITIGDPVAISIDAYPDVSLTGHVATIIQATNSQFSLIPAEGVSGTFIKVAQRVPLRIELDSVPELPLTPGLSVVVRIDTRREPAPSTVARTHE